MPVNYTIEQMSRFRRWLFEVGTRVVELLNGCLLISFSAVMGINYYKLLHLPSYFRFNVTDVWQWLVVFVLGVLQLTAMYYKSNRSNQVSGLLLIFSGCIWLIIASIFSVNKAQVITTGVTTYLIIAWICLLAGYELLTINKAIEDYRNDCQANCQKTCRN